MTGTDRPKIFISYCHADMSKARKIEADLEVVGVEIVRDERSLRYTGDIESYMKTIRTSDYALVLVSDAFLRSVACMFEIHEFFKDEDYKERILPVILDTYIEQGITKLGAQIYDYNNIANYISYWEQKEREVRERLLDFDVANICHFSTELALIQSVTKTVGSFISLLGKIKHVTLDQLIMNDYQELLSKIGYDNITLNQIKQGQNLYSRTIAEVTLEGRLKFLTRALKINPFYVDALSQRSKVYNELKEYDKALQDNEAAITLAPWRGDLYITRSYTHIRQGKLDEALKDLDVALLLEPRHKMVYNNRADLFRRLGRLGEAELEVRKALEIIRNLILHMRRLRKLKLYILKMGV